MTEQELMQLAKKKVHAKMAFHIHLIATVSIVALLLIIYFYATPGEFFWPVVPIIALGIGLVVHAVISSSIFNSEYKIKAEYDRLKQIHGVEN